MRPSHRPDLSDLQIALPKTAKAVSAVSDLYGTTTLAPQIAKAIIKDLSSESELAGIEYGFDAGGPAPDDEKRDPRGQYLNIRFSDAFLVRQIQNIAESEAQDPTAKKQKILIDYGSPNIGKAMHVGHIRSGVIGQSLHNLAEKLGHTVIADSHVGDWGQPMGMIIAELKSRFPHWSCFQSDFNPRSGFELPISENGGEGELSISELNAVYPTASQKAKDDADFLELVRQTTADLQSGQYPGYTELWRAFRAQSLKQVNETYGKLGVSFDREEGESAYHDEIGEMIEELTARGLVRRNEEDELVMDVDRTALIKGLEERGIIVRYGSSLFVNKDKEQLLTDIVGREFLQSKADGTLRRNHNGQLIIAASRTEMIATLKEGGIVHADADGQLVVDKEKSDYIAALREQGLLTRQGEDVERNKEGEPIIDPNKIQDIAIRPIKLQTSDGAYTYGASDLAAIRKRVREDGPDAIWYVVDKRQGPHFEQVFRAAKIAGYSGDTRLEHLAFGTYNGPDGKPFRTRAGGIMSLEHMLQAAEDEVKRNCSVDKDNIPGLAASSLIFNDLINNPESDVTFLSEQLLEFGGKSVASVEYAYGHLSSLLQKPLNDASPEGISLDAPTRQLAMLLTQKEHIMERAFELRTPNLMTEYLYDVSRAFDRVYRDLDAAEATITPFMASLAKATQSTMEEYAKILGITLTSGVRRKAEEHTKNIEAINTALLDNVPPPPPRQSQPVPLAEGEFDAFKQKCERFADLLEAKRPELLKALQIYEPASTAEDEIDLACRCLRDLDQYRDNFTHKVPKVAALLHANLPIYYYVVLGVIPSLMAQEVHVRPNQHMQDKKVIDALKAIQIDPDDSGKNIFNYFDNIITHAKMGRDQFFATHLANCDYGIVNGSYEAGHELMTKYMKPGAVLVSEGKHHDPFIVTSTADIPKAVERAVHLKAYNGGQECAAPDAILVHESVAEEFTRQFKEAYFGLKVGGSYTDPEVRIGPPAAGEADLKHAAEFLSRFRAAHPHVPIQGGHIDWEKGVINPALIVSKLGDMSVPPNYEELFNPIQFIHTYKNTGELRRYFTDERYGVNKGYVSLFCNEDAQDDKIRDWILKRNDDVLGLTENERASGYLSGIDKYGIGRVIVNGSIHNLLQDEPLAPFGGYSAASFIMRKVDWMDDGKDLRIESACLPISHSEIMRDYLIRQNPVTRIGKVPKLPEISIPELTNIDPPHGLIGTNAVEVAAAYRDPQSLDVNVAYFLDQRRQPDPSARGEARAGVERRLARHNNSMGDLTFVTTDYVRRELMKSPSFYEAPEQLVKAVLALQVSVGMTTENHRMDGDSMVAEELRVMGKQALERWKLNILQELPYGDSGEAHRIKELAQKRPEEVVAMAMKATGVQGIQSAHADNISEETGEKKPIPELRLGGGQYHMSALVEADYEDLLKMAQTPNFLFAPLNGRKALEGTGRMPLEDSEGSKGSVRRYIEEAAEGNNYIFAIRDASNKVVGAIELIGIQRKGEGYEAEIGIFVEPAHQNQVNLNSALTPVLQWANANLGINSLRVTTDPDNRNVRKLIDSMRKTVQIAQIPSQETSYTDLNGEERPRAMYLIPPAQLSAVMARGGLEQAGAWTAESLASRQAIGLGKAG
ncbi:MAG TPA: arginine--tRNA ligase [Rickettsiales bacterium]|nr:arginine--tRNA ligase [Rickettsiales bacterium]